MKKILLTVAILSSIILINTIAEANNQYSQEKGYISVNTIANTEIAPDVVEVAFAVKTTDTKSIQKATLLNKEISDKLYLLLSDMLTPAKGDYIKTANFNASPVYNYSGSKKLFDRYEVSNRVIIHTKNIEKVGVMIDKAIDAGATNVDSLTFSVSDYEKQCNDLIKIAVQKANTRAEIIAKSTSSILDGIKSFNVNCSADNYNAPRMYMAKNLLSTTADEASVNSATSISSGVIKINANANAQYFVK